MKYFNRFSKFHKKKFPQKCLLNHLLTLTINKEYLFVVHNLTQQTVIFFQNLLCLWTRWVFLSRPQLERNHFLVPLPKMQQVYMVQPFVHFRRSLKSHSLDYRGTFRIMYDLCEIYNKHNRKACFTPFRPIVSALKTPTYIMVKFLVHF